MNISIVLFEEIKKKTFSLLLCGHFTNYSFSPLARGGGGGEANRLWPITINFLYIQCNILSTFLYIDMFSNSQIILIKNFSNIISPNSHIDLADQAILSITLCIFPSLYKYLLPPISNSFFSYEGY